MRNIKLTIAYDGADFHGWQTQPGFATIQGAHQRRRAQNHAGKNRGPRREPHRRGRSRAGTGRAFPNASRRFRPPKFSARSTRCCLRRFASSTPRKPAPIFTRAGRRRARPIATAFIAGASCRHSNTAARCTIPGRSTKTRWPPPRANSKASTISVRSPRRRARKKTIATANMTRVIYSSEIVREPDREEIAYVVRGQSFLRYMVRKIVGTLIEVGKGRLAPGDIPRIFEAARPLALRPHGPCRRAVPRLARVSRSHGFARSVAFRRPSLSPRPIFRSLGFRNV